MAQAAAYPYRFAATSIATPPFAASYAVMPSWYRYPISARYGVNREPQQRDDDERTKPKRKRKSNQKINDGLIFTSGGPKRR